MPSAEKGCPRVWEEDGTVGDRAGVSASGLASAPGLLNCGGHLAAQAPIRAPDPTSYGQLNGSQDFNTLGKRLKPALRWFPSTCSAPLFVMSGKGPPAQLHKPEAGATLWCSPSAPSQLESLAA